MSAITIRYNNKNHSYIDCLKTTPLKEALIDIDAYGGLSMYAGSTKNLVHISMSADDTSTLKIAARENILKAIKTADKGALRNFAIRLIGTFSTTDKESLNVLMDSAGKVIYADSELGLNIHCWKWINFSLDRDLACMLERITNDEHILIALTKNVTQVWSDFRYAIAYYPMKDKLNLIEDKLDVDFWLYTRIRYPKMYNEAKKFNYWSGHSHVLKSMREIWEKE